MDEDFGIETQLQGRGGRRSGARTGRTTVMGAMEERKQEGYF